jgi:hypothetical protein
MSESRSHHSFGVEQVLTTNREVVHERHSHPKGRKI